MSGSTHGHADAPHAPVFTGEVRSRLEALFPQYPTKQACLLPALWMVQEARGWIAEPAIHEVAEVLARLWGGPETLLVISSDLSHYETYARAQQHDAATAAAIERLDGAALGPRDACGYLPIRGLLIEARRRVVDLSAEAFGLRPSLDENLVDGFLRAVRRRGWNFLVIEDTTGLAMTYGAVHQAGGSIEVHSELGIGTTFKIYLPRVEGEDETASPDPAPAPHGTETVLVAEDDAQIRDFVTRVLSAKGYRVLSASDGFEALRLCGECADPVDLLVTDVVMPRMGGRELASRVETARPGTRVLFVSGYTEDAISHHGVLEAGLEFLQKPFTSDALLRKVRGILDR